MRCIQLMVIIVLLSTTTLTLPIIYRNLIYAAEQETPDTLKEARNRLGDAYQRVQEAEDAGATKNEAESLVSKLNRASDLIREAEDHYTRGDLMTSEDYAKKAIDESSRVEVEARQTHENASQRMFRTKVLTYMSAPLAALVLAILSHYGYSWWREREFKRLLKMEIREVKKKR